MLELTAFTWSFMVRVGNAPPTYPVELGHVMVILDPDPGIGFGEDYMGYLVEMEGTEKIERRFWDGLLVLHRLSPGEWVFDTIDPLEHPVGVTIEAGRMAVLTVPPPTPVPAQFEVNLLSGWEHVVEGPMARNQVLLVQSSRATDTEGRRFRKLRAECVDGSVHRPDWTTPTSALWSVLPGDCRPTLRVRRHGRWFTGDLVGIDWAHGSAAVTWREGG